MGSARLWESAPFVGLTLFASLTYIPGKKKEKSSAHLGVLVNAILTWNGGI